MPSKEQTEKEFLEALNRLYPGSFRPVEKIGNCALSVQASQTYYCVPRVNGLRIEEYELVEIAVLDPDDNLVIPSKIGIDGFDHLFESNNSPVAGYVSQKDLANLRRQMIDKLTPALPPLATKGRTR